MKTALENISNILTSNHQRIAVAESVTSGGIQSILSLAPNSTCFFCGGITAYNLEAKAHILHVDEQHAKNCNCVSDIVSSQMAVNVSKMFATEYGIGITGYTAPVPELGIYHLYAFYTFSYNGQIKESG